MEVAKVIEISSSSERSFEDAIANGITRASGTVHGIKGAWVKEQKVEVRDGAIAEYRVCLKVSFLLD